MRHDVEIPQQHAVERHGGGDQFGTVFGKDHAIDQRIDRRVLDADQIARAGLIGGGRTPEAALLVAGRQRFTPGRDDDVEIPLPQPVLVLRGIDHARVHRHADAFERGLVEQHEALGRRIVDQELDAESLAGLCIDQFRIAYLVAGVAEQRERLAKIVAHRLRIAAGRIAVGLAEKVRRHLVAHGFENLQLLAFRQPGRRQFGALEITGYAFVLAEENRPVHFLEVESEVEGAAHARVLELVAPDVERERLHDAEISDRKFLQHHALVAHGGEIVGRRPVLGAVLGAPIHLVALEGFQGHRGIAEIFEAELLEIPGADGDIDILTPIVGDLLVDD